jgi:hypothetical protein
MLLLSVFCPRLVLTLVTFNDHMLLLLLVLLSLFVQDWRGSCDHI